MTVETRNQYERAAILAARAAQGDTYAAKWAEIHIRLANVVQRQPK